LREGSIPSGPPTTISSPHKLAALHSAICWTLAGAGRRGGAALTDLETVAALKESLS
jgi:hypothetical protein